MRRTNRSFFAGLLAAGALATLGLFAGAGARAQAPVQPQAPAAPKPPAAAPRPGQGQIQVQTNLVVLRISVVDDRGKFVPGLKQDAFKVFEDKVPQTLSIFHQEDVPVSMGLVIDNSGSMREKRPLVNAAAITLVKLSNPQDEEFVVNFADDYFLDTVHDFTANIGELQDALERIDTRGSTALYDAVIGSLDHLKKGKRDKKVLVVVTDGEDNASRRTLANAVQEAQRSEALIYAIGLYSAEDVRHDRAGMKKARKALTDLAEATGGLAFFPESAADTKDICTQIAHDIRNQYTLAYYSTNAEQDGTYRNVQVQLNPPRGAGKLFVRTRPGYYAPRGPARAYGN